MLFVHQVLNAKEKKAHISPFLPRFHTPTASLDGLTLASYDNPYVTSITVLFQPVTQSERRALFVHGIYFFSLCYISEPTMAKASLYSLPSQIRLLMSLQVLMNMVLFLRADFESLVVNAIETAIVYNIL